MTPQVSITTIDETVLRKTLTELSGKPLTAIYLESETRIVLTGIEDFLGPKITLPPVRWLVGRAFGPMVEIRWRLDGEQFEATALTENVALKPSGWKDSPWMSRLDSVTRLRDVLLVGLNSTALPPDHAAYNARPGGGLWLDMQIPRPLTYPAPDPTAERVVLSCIDYLSRGLVVLTRLCALESYRNPK